MTVLSLDCFMLLCVNRVSSFSCSLHILTNVLNLEGLVIFARYYKNWILCKHHHLLLASALSTTVLNDTFHCYSGMSLLLLATMDCLYTQG